MFACREAARKASAFADDGTYVETKEPLRLPAFEKVIGFAVQKALEDWRDEALEGECWEPSKFVLNMSPATSCLAAMTAVCC